MVLYRKYRPQKFSDIVGQEPVVDTLLSQLNSGKISHGYLFCGPKGTGKTSTARILAKAVNCERTASGKSASSKKPPYTQRYTLNAKYTEPCNKCNSCLAVANGSHLDLVEIDAASNRNIDDIRDLREKIKLSPVSSKFKIYIIDEVHMLTKEAFNALLKTLEEPPAHAIFILCTTDVGKLPQTIISRVQKFNFARASEDRLVRAIERIAKAEKIQLTAEAAVAIAKVSDGSYRDAVSTLDQLTSEKGKVRPEDVSKIAFFANWDHTFEFVKNLLERDAQKTVSEVEKLVNSGVDVSFFAREVVLLLEKILFLKLRVVDDFEISKDQLNKLETLANQTNIFHLQNIIKLLVSSEADIKFYPLPQIPFILAVCKFCLSESGEQFSPTVKNDEIKEREATKPKITIEKQKNPKYKKSAQLSEILKNWNNFLSKVRPVNAHVMAILRATKPVEFIDGKLTLEVYYRFHKEKLEESKIASMLEGKLEEVINSQVTVNIVLAAKETKPPKPVSESDVVDVDIAHIEKISSDIAEIFSK